MGDQSAQQATESLRLQLARSTGATHRFGQPLYLFALVIHNLTLFPLLYPVLIR
jgi:hypothetical protein